jgi:IBR domain, a half RING-finger domain
VIKSVLTKDEQHAFMKSLLQFSTPWESRIFCPNPTCGEFIPRRGKIDPKHPFEVVCRKCRSRACSTCKRAAHAFGQDCPADWELDAVLQMGEKSGWRRCYKCRTLVELTQGCSHITCRCKAQFCYICGAVWDPVVGCPNYCNGEEELERRRLEEEARIAEEEAEKIAREEAEKLEAAEKIEAEKRTASSGILNDLRAQQINERDRFSAFERKMKWIMWTRHGQAKLDVLDRYGDLQAKMKERHIKTATHLEDRQVGAEMELRVTLKQAERSVKIRLRHMEAYCDGLGRSASGDNPSRVVTERDLRELGQQYNIRDDMERLHQSKINVMRDKQAKQMEQLLVRQEEELDKLADKQNSELEALEETFGIEEDGFVKIFRERRERLRRRWSIIEEVERKKLEMGEKANFAPLAPVPWLDLEPKQDELLAAVTE